jgi:signal transduction histidine kinase
MIISVVSLNAQPPANGRDSSFFDNFFSRYLLLIDKDSAQAIDSLEIIKGIAEQKNLTPVLSHYYLERAALFIKNYKNDSALDCYAKAVEFAKKQNSRRELGNAYLTIGNFYQYNGNTIAAAENYLLATQLLKELGRKRALVGLYVNLYIIMNRLQQKNVTLSNSLSALIAGKKTENDLIAIINTAGSEEVGFSFPDQTLLKEAGRDPIYVIFGNAKFAVTSHQNMGSYGSFRDVQRIPPGTIARIPDFPRNGSILRELDSPFIYVALDGVFYQIKDLDVLETYGGWDGVYFVPPGSLARFPKSQDFVTIDNRFTKFNFNQEFDILADSIRSALNRNTLLSRELSKVVSERNRTLQNRKTLLWVSAVGLSALLIIVLLLIRNFRQTQRLNLQTMRSLKKQEELERKTAIEKERTRIATDMHDDLGAGLSRIKFLSETIGIKKQQSLPVEEEIGSIRSYSHEMIDKMGEIVWALNEKNDSLSDLLSYTRSYAVEYLSQHGLDCLVTIPDELPLIRVSGEFRRNVYLVVKEALHNIVKHSQAKTVAIKVITSPTLQVSIHDNGIGLDSTLKRPFSNGLMNMKKRISDIGGQLDVHNDSGTTVRFSVPLPS